jgi:hypothetical protein
MRPLLAHCHHGLGRLYAQIGQQQQACAALSAAVDLCRGLEMPCWLPQAEAALAQVNKTWHAQEGPPGAGKVPWESSHRKRLKVYAGRFKMTLQRASLTWWGLRTISAVAHRGRSRRLYQPRCWSPTRACLLLQMEGTDHPEPPELSEVAACIRRRMHACENSCGR